MRKKVEAQREDLEVNMNAFFNFCLEGKLGEVAVQDVSRIWNYRRLVFTVFEDALSTAYPITKSIMNKANWIDLVTGFMKENRHAEKELWKMPVELIGYCEEFNIAEKTGIPYLTDLLRFEWAETIVFCEKDFSDEEVERFVFQYKGKPFRFGPHFRLVDSKWEIHTSERGKLRPTFYFVYRNADLQASYLIIPPIYAYIVQNIEILLEEGVEKFLKIVEFSTQVTESKLRKVWEQFFSSFCHLEIIKQVNRVE